MNRDTVRVERQRNPEFARRMSEADVEIGEQLESRALEEALGGENKLLWQLLQKRKPERYGDTLREDQLVAIKQEAKREMLAEIDREIARLPERRRGS